MSINWKNCKIPPKKKAKPYTDEDLLNALYDVRQNDLSVRNAALKYNIPKTNLGDWVSGRYARGLQKPGPKSTTRRIIGGPACCIYRSNGASREEFGLAVKDVLQREEEESIQAGNEVNEDGRLFVNNLPPKNWVQRFVQRHLKVTLGTPQPLGHMRMGLSKETLIWFANDFFFCGRSTVLMLIFFPIFLHRRIQIECLTWVSQDFRFRLKQTQRYCWERSKKCLLQDHWK